MIQIEDWVIIAILFTFFVADAVYLFYFIVTRKLFSQEKEFQREISPNTAVTIHSIEGAGIIKKIKMQVTENDNSLIDIIVDGTSFSTFSISNSKNTDKEFLKEGNQKLLKLEINVNSRFHKQFSLFIHNRSDDSINSTGKIYYEIKKPLKVVLKALYS